MLGLGCLVLSPLPLAYAARVERVYEEYEVKRGDSLSSIARQYNLTSRELMLLNKLGMTPLKVGQVIRIPVSPDQASVVAPVKPDPPPESTTASTDTFVGDGVGMALIIGIGNYDILGPLASCREDAKAFSKALLAAGYSPKRVVLLTDDAAVPENKATYTNIKRRLKQVCEFAKQTDSLIVYFAGHGTLIDEEVFLIPQDGDEKDRDNGVPLTKLQQQMQDSKASRKLLVLDACHSGGSTRGVSGVTPSLKTAGVHVMASCAANELSHPDTESKHGIFTRYLLEGLNGSADANADKNVSQLELFDYVQGKMTSWGLKTGKTQRPQMLSPTRDDLIIAKLPGAAPATGGTNAPASAPTSAGSDSR
jgi:LysM repeat protein